MSNTHLLAFDALLFGAVAMSLDLLMGYTAWSPSATRRSSARCLCHGRLLERGVFSLALLGLAAVVVGLYALT